MLLRPTARQPVAAMAGRPSNLVVSCLVIWLTPQVVLHVGLAEYLALSPNPVTCQLPISAPAHNLQPAGHTMPQWAFRLAQG